jgi:acetyltransferase-like isoleucine patch superfamily enzyme
MIFMLIISKEARISNLADIEDSVRGTRIVIGKGVVIDSFVKIKPVGGSGDIEIGENTYINSGGVIFSGNGVKIGENVLIAPGCIFAPVNHEYRKKDRTIREQRFMPSRGGIIIGDDVWIGAHTTVLDGTVINKGVVIGANSLVTGELEQYCVYAGNPLKQIGRRT